MDNLKYALTIFFFFLVFIGFAMAFSELDTFTSSAAITSQVFVGTVIGFLGFQGLLLQYYLSQKNK